MGVNRIAIRTVREIGVILSRASQYQNVTKSLGRPTQQKKRNRMAALGRSNEGVR